MNRRSRPLCLYTVRRCRTGGTCIHSHLKTEVSVSLFRTAGVIDFNKAFSRGHCRRCDLSRGDRGRAGMLGRVEDRASRRFFRAHGRPRTLNICVTIASDEGLRHDRRPWPEVGAEHTPARPSPAVPARPHLLAAGEVTRPRSPQQPLTSSADGTAPRAVGRTEREGPYRMRHRCNDKDAIHDFVFAKTA